MEKDLEEELSSLKAEALYILHEEVNRSLQQLQDILQLATSVMINNAPQVEIHDNVSVKPQKFIISSTSPQQSVKCVLTLEGDLISDLDLSFKMPRQNAPIITKLYPQLPWRLQQLMDSRGFLQRALWIVEEQLDTKFTTFSQVLQLYQDLFTCLERGRSALIQPKKRSVDELISNPILACLKPSLPPDVAISVYLQAQRLVLCIYQISTNGTLRYPEVTHKLQVDCTVPWLTDLLANYTLALDCCQQLVNKVNTISEVLPDISQNDVVSSSSCPVDDLLMLHESTTEQTSPSGLSADITGLDGIVTSSVKKQTDKVTVTDPMAFFSIG